MDVDEPGFAGENRRSQDVVAPAGLRNDVGLDGVGAEAVQGPTDGPHRLHGLGGAATQDRRRRGKWTTLGELAGQLIEPLLGIQLRVVVQLTAPGIKLRKDVVVFVGVLANVHDSEVKPEGGDSADQALDAAPGDLASVVFLQRRLHQGQLVEQRTGR